MTVLLAAAALLLSATPAIETQQGPHRVVAGPVEKRSLVYGPEHRQYLELFTKARAGRAPLVVYVHGGGWIDGSPRAGSGGAQAEFYTSRGFAYATIGHRYVPVVPVEQQLADIARAIAYLRNELDVDARRIVLVGHSSGAHLAALLASDPSYFQAAKLKFESIRGVVLLDPAAFDLQPLMASGGGSVERYFKPTFGTDPARWSALSPVTQTAAPNAPLWAILHDGNNLFAAGQAADFAAGLIAGGAKATVQPIANTTHMRLNDEIGVTGDPASEAVAALLAQAVPETQRPRFR